jgi:single-stranded DNA-binding protein
MSIECAFFGFLATDAEPRTSQAGKPWVRMRVGTGKDDTVQWISVAVFGPAAEHAARLKKSDRCYVEGTIKIEYWQTRDGADRHGLNVAAFKCERTHQIGRDRPRRRRERAEPTFNGEHQPPATAAFDDEIGF